MKPAATAGLRAKKPATKPARTPLVPGGAPSASAGKAQSAETAAAAAPNSAARDWLADTARPTPHIAADASAYATALGEWGRKLWPASLLPSDRQHGLEEQIETHRRP